MENAIMRLMLKYIFGFLLVTLILAGCSAHTDSFQGIIDSVYEGGIKVNCSDEINKGKKNVNSIGYICSVNVTKDTALHGTDGESLAVEDFQPGSEVKVVLSEQVNFSREYGKLPTAKEIILVKRVEYIEPYDFKRNDVESVVIYYGDSEEKVTEINEVEQLNELSDILQSSQPFSGNATTDLNCIIEVITTTGEARIIEIWGRSHIFTDGTTHKTYSLDHERFMMFLEQLQVN